MLRHIFCAVPAFNLVDPEINSSFVSRIILHFPNFSNVPYFDRTNIQRNETRYYKVVVEDYWGQKVESKISQGSSYLSVVFDKNYSITLMNSDFSGTERIIGYGQIPKWSNSGDKIIFKFGDKLKLIDISNNTETIFNTNSSGDQSNTFSNDDLKFYFMGSDGLVNILDLESGNVDIFQHWDDSDTGGNGSISSFD